MHWSSLLERRFIPGDARIIGELSCPGCGYSLKGLEALGRCPECGRPVLDAIRPIPKPAELAKSLGETGWAFLTLLPLVFVSLYFAPIVAGVGVMLLLVLAGFRAFAAVGLHRILLEVPSHGCAGAARRLVVGVAVEFVPIVVLLVMTITHLSGSAPGWIATVTGLTPLALLLVATLEIGLVADLARRIAAWLELDRMAREALWSLRLLAAGCALIVVTALLQPGVPQFGGLAVFGAFGMTSGAMVMAARALWRAAASIPHLDHSPASLIDRPLMSPAELKERGLLGRPHHK